MNNKLRLISLALLISMMNSSVSYTGQCSGSGFGIALGLSLANNNAKLDINGLNNGKNKQYEELMKKLQEALKKQNGAFATPNTKDTGMEDGGSELSIAGYEESDITNNTNKDKLPENSKEIKLKSKKFKSNNPTKYKIYTTANAKYNANGFFDANGSEKTIPILMSPNIISENNITYTRIAGSGTDLMKKEDYGTLVDKDNKTLYITPLSADYLDEINAPIDDNNKPSHVCLSDLNPTISAFLKDAFANSDVYSQLKSALQASGATETDDNVIFKDGDEYFVNTINTNSLGVDEVAIPNIVKTVNGDTTANNSFKDIDKWSVGVVGGLSYQYRLYDWLIKVGIFVNVPIANRTIPFEDSNSSNSENNKSNSNNNNLSLTYSWEAYAQLLLAYNLTKNISIEGGIEFGYMKLKVNNVNNLYGIYSLENDKLASWIKAGDPTALDSYNQSLKDMGISSDSTEKELGKWFARGVVGFRFDFGKFSVGLQAFCGTKLNLHDSKSKFPLSKSNFGARLLLQYVF